MNYLTIIALVWTLCGICAVLFIRGATARENQLVPARAVDTGIARADELRHTA
jgi:hypothetical protein